MTTLSLKAPISHPARTAKTVRAASTSIRLLAQLALFLAAALGSVFTNADIAVAKSVEQSLDISGNTNYRWLESEIAQDTLQVTGNSNGLSVPHSADIAASNEDFAVSFWYRPEQSHTGAWRIIMLKGNSANERNHSIWMHPNTNQLHFRISTDVSWNDGGNSNSQLLINHWYHISYVKEGNQLKLYINGRLDATDTIGNTVSVNDGPFYLGDTPWHQPALGSLAAVNVYQRKLTALEARALYLNKRTEFEIEEQALASGTPQTVGGVNSTAVGRSFDSDEDSLILANSINLQPGTSNFAIAMWLKLNANADGQARNILFKGADANSHNYSLALAADSNRIAYKLSTDNNALTGRETNTELTLNEWTHIAYVKNGAKLQLFINGSKDSEVDLVGNPVLNTASLYMGSSPFLNAARVSIDNVSMFNYQLDSNDIARIISEPASNNAELGSWGEVIPWPQVPVSAANLPDGRILTWSGSERTTWPGSEQNYSSTWDPSTNEFNELYTEGHNMFCAHLAMTEEGQVFVNGGRNQLNSPWTSLFNFENNEWTMVENMATGGRWYPVTMALPSGEVMTSMGTASNFNNPEKWSPSKGWQVLNSVNYSAMRTTRDGTSGQRRWWPNLSVTPSGEVYHFWSTEENHLINTEGTGSFQNANSDSNSDDVAPGVTIQYDAGKMLVTGDNQGTWLPSSRRNQAFTIDLNTPTPTIRTTQDMTTARRFHNLVPLPNGHVMAVGGSRNSGGFNNIGSVFDSELWDPETGQWTRTANSAVPRNYHSVALLLNDGRVLSAGGGYGSGNEFLNGASHQNGQIYTPPYLYNEDGTLATRPTIISGPGEISAGQTFTLETSQDAKRFSLLRMGSTTHAVNTDARFHWVDAVEVAPGQFELSAHENANVLIPGYWMLFALNDAGVPSEAHVVKVTRATQVSTPGDIRYARLIAESETNGKPWTSAAEINVLDANGDTIARDDWLVEVDSQHTVGNTGVFSRALDGDPNTIWHTDWSPAGDDNDPAHEHYFSIDLRGGYTLSAITYLPRQDASFNGHIADYRVEISADGIEWSIVAEGTMPQTKDLQTIAIGQRPSESGIIVSTPSASQEETLFEAIDGLGLEYNWSFGDGSADSGFSSAHTVSHVFTTPGKYIVVVTVRNPLTGEEAQFTTTKIVYDAQLDDVQPSRWASSTSIAYHPSLNQVWNVNPDNNSVTVTDSATRAVLAEVSVQAKPSAVAFDAVGNAWVSNKHSGSISVINATTFAVDATIELDSVGAKPHGIVIKGSYAYIALEGFAEVIKVDTVTRSVAARKSVLSNPRAMAISPDNSRLYVSDFVTANVIDESTVAPDVLAGTDSIRVIDPANFNEVGSVVLQYSEDEISENTGPGIPNYVAGLAMHPLGETLYVASKQDNILGGTRRSGASLTFDQTVRAISSRIDADTLSEDVISRIDHDNASISSAAVFGPYGIHLFTALEGNRQIAVSTPASDSEIARFDVGRAPQGLALSPDGRTLVSHNFMDRSISFMDVSDIVELGQLTPTVLDTVTVVNSETLQPEILLGKQLFYDAKDDRLAALDYMSCASCHNEGGQDGRIWDFSQFGEGLRNTISLNGKGGMAHGLLHWTGNFDELQDFEGQIRNFAGGTGLMANADFFALDRSEPLGAEKAGISSDLDALAAYMSSLVNFEPHALSDIAVTPEARRGEALFDQKGCASCHSDSSFTDSSSGARHNIGSLTEASGERLNQPLDGVDTPTLLGLLNTGPYLHDGSAATIEEAILVHSGTDLSNDELLDLTTYLYQAPLPPAPNTPAWQAGSLNVVQQNASSWYTATYATPFAQPPIVVTGGLSYNGGDPVTLRIRNVTAEGFEYQIDEWDYRDGYHVSETIPYLAMLPGQHDINGLAVEASEIAVNQSWFTLSFSQTFATAPIVMAQVTTVNEADAVTTRVRNISTQSMQVQLEEQEANAQQHAAESVHVVAIEPGTAEISGRKVTVGRTARVVKHNWYTVSHNQALGDATLLVGMQSTYGGDTSTTRIRNVDANSFQVQVDEEQSRENEVGHTTEIMGWIAIEN